MVKFAARVSPSVNEEVPKAALSVFWLALMDILLLRVRRRREEGQRQP